MKVTDAGNPPHETPEQLRARLLRCPKVKASVCKVAHSQGVAHHEEEDVCQDTLLRVSQTRLPSSEAEARKYINGIARFVAIDHRRKKAEGSTESLEAVGREAPSVRERLEQRAFMQALFAQGSKRFGKSFEWFVRAKVHRETSEEIGAAAGVTPSHVRKEVSLVSRWFDGAWGRRTGIGSVLTLVIAVGAGWWTTHRADRTKDSEFATYAEVKTQQVHAMDAQGLRARGRKACDDGAWGACEHDLEAAAAMDPQGETPELGVLKATAIERQVRVGAKADWEEQENAKPGR